MRKNLKKHPLFHAAILGVVMTLTGCAQGPVLRVQPVAQQSYPPSNVVETLKSLPFRPYIVLARIHAQAPAGTPPAQVLAAIERKAASLGADAIVIQDHSRQTASALQFNPAGGNYQNVPAQIIPIYDATAIRWSTGPLDPSPKGVSE